MIEHFDYMSQIEHQSGYLFVVTVDLNEKYLIAHPKYCLKGGSNRRISNPVDPKRNNRIDIEGTTRIGSKDYLLLKEDVIKYYPCFGISKELKDGSQRSAQTRKKAYSLIEKLSEYIPEDRIGITGSLATGFATDNYSDIDILLQEADFRALKNSVFFNDEEIEFRTVKQWIDFYECYGVYSALSSEEFAKVANKNKQQFIYQGIPVSIFVSGSDRILSILNSFTIANNSSMRLLKGEVIFESLINLPGYMLMNCDEQIIVIINYHRTYQNCLNDGDYCSVYAQLSSFENVYHVLYDNKCFIKMNAGDSND